MEKRKLLFILEGVDREIDIFNNATSVFLNSKCDVIPISVPADMNIYMLYQSMEKDDFETDIVEILREKVPAANEVLKDYKRNDFSEIYYFFDFDEQAYNLGEKSNVLALHEMLTKLNNETELGKLYISYPMVEAVRDYIANNCKTVSGSCYRKRNEFGKYKNDSAKDPNNNDFKNYNFPKWKEIIEFYINRAACLFNIPKLDRNIFINKITPFSIFAIQMNFYEKDEKIFILSCLPEFLIDYSEKYWNLSVGNRKSIVRNSNCEKK